MKEVTVVVPARYIAALMLFAPVSDASRSCLEGIQFEVGAGEMRLVATDGARLGVARIPHDEPLELDGPVSAIVPRSLLEGIKASLPVHVVIILGAPADGAEHARHVTVRAAGVDRVGLTIDARFPDWRRVIPRTVTGEAAQFNPIYVGDLAKVRKALDPRGDSARVRLAHNGKGTAWIDFGLPDFMGVLMPVVYGDKVPPLTFPEWAVDDLDSLV